MAYGTPREPFQPSEHIQALLRDHRRRNTPAYRRRSKALGVLGAIGAVALLVAALTGFWLLVSWYLMLGIGIAHLDWWHAMPSMGYGTALLLDIFLGGWIGATVSLSLAFKSKRS